VEVEALLEPGLVGRARALDVDPPEPGGFDDLDARAVALGDALGQAGAGAPTEAWLGQARHGRGLLGSSVGALMP
jgi:hypothetical protein